MKNLTILFDMDGTLIDSTSAILESFEAAAKSMGVRFADTDKIVSLIGYPLDIIFERLGIEADKTDEFVHAYKNRYKTVATQKTVLINGAKEAVEEAHEFARLGIVTTKTALYTKEILAHFGILQLFETVVGREDVKNTKPHPEPVLKALEAMNADKNSAWIIGDTILDMGAGAASVIKCAAVLCGYGKKEDLAKYTDAIFKDTLEAVRHIKNFKN
ncbi:MAG: HAD family hydrolase [Campylobacteraceae bacterium]|jgi:phosphoglycolate phosphatase|nr:HAD family hydrolase [Campylobacteraceae bacterium]